MLFTDLIKEYKALDLTFDIGLKLAPSFVLVYAVLRLRTLIKRSGSAEFFAKEHLMKVHTLMYLAYSLVYILRVVVNWIWTAYATDGDNETACRWLKVAITLKCLCGVSNIASVIFFAYMTIKFSAPMTEYWQEFMLVYQTNLEQLGRVSQNMREHGRA